MTGTATLALGCGATGWLGMAVVPAAFAIGISGAVTFFVASGGVRSALLGTWGPFIAAAVFPGSATHARWGA